MAVDHDKAIVFINEIFIREFDIEGLMSSGKVYLVSAGIGNKSAKYEDFKVFSLQNSTTEITEDSPKLPVQPPEKKPSSHPSKILKLNNEQKVKLREALLSAFLEQVDLEIMLNDKLEINLNQVATGKNYTIIMHNLIRWFEAQGRLQDLIQAAYEANPRNPNLSEFVREIGLN